MAPKTKNPIAEAAKAAVEPAPVEAQEEATPAAVLPDTPYVFGEPAPDDVVLSLEKNKIVEISPMYLSVKRGFNVRDFSAKENVDHVNQMRANLENNGWLAGTALTVFREPDVDDPTQTRIVVWRGETRTRAIREIIALKGEAGFTLVPVILVDLPSSAQVAADFEVSNSGKKLNMLEQFEIVRRLLDENVGGPTAIGKMMGISHTQVGNIRLLGFATPAMRSFVQEGWMSATNLYEEIRDAKIREKVGEDQAIEINKLEKKLQTRVTKAKNLDKKAGSHGQAELKEGEEEVEKPRKVQKPDDAAFTKTTYLALLGMMRQLLKTYLMPAKDYQKVREAIKACLKSNGLDVVSDAEKAEAEAVQALQNEDKQAS